MYDPTSTYRSTQVATSGPAAQVVLLYQGALRFGAQHLAALRRGDLEAAHNASIRCQTVVSGLQESLNLSAGPIAAQLESLYVFCLDRLVAGNIHKDPRPTEEALIVLRDLLGAWQELASLGAGPLPVGPAAGVHQAGAARGPAMPAVAGVR